MKTAELIQIVKKLRTKKPVEFIEQYLTFQGKPFRLYPFQKAFAKDTNFLREKIAIKKARQIGGSLLVAALIVYYVAVNTYCTIIIVSKTKDQASLISTYVREFFQSSVLRDLIDPTDTTVLDLYLRNKSKVITRSAGQVRADTLRGHTIGGNGCLVFDESAYIPAEAIRNTYFAAAGNCGIVHCSTPGRPVGAFYDACRSKFFKCYHYPASVSPRLTADDIAFWRSDLSGSKQANEIDAEFAQGDNCVFAEQLIIDAIDENLPVWGKPMTGDSDKNYIASLDVSKIGHDRNFLTIGELDQGVMKIVAYDSWMGTMHQESGATETHFTDNPQDIINGLMAYHKEKNFHLSKIYVDATSNEFFAWTLQNKYLLNVEPVTFSTSKKDRLVSHLESCFKANRLKIPRSDQIRRELLSFSYDWETLKDNSDKRLYLGGGEDDSVSSLMMIAQSITIQKRFNFKDTLIWR